MKGKIVGASIFLLLSGAVALAAVGAISQAYGGAAPVGFSSMAMSQYETFPERAEAKNENGAYRAFSYVCPFH